LKNKSPILELDSIHSGFAARCEARLRLAVQFEFRMGFALGSGSALLGQGRTKGIAQAWGVKFYGEAEPRLTSGGGAAARESKLAVAPGGGAATKKYYVVKAF